MHNQVPPAPRSCSLGSRKSISIAKDLFNRHPGRTLHICLQSLQRSYGQVSHLSHLLHPWVTPRQYTGRTLTLERCHRPVIHLWGKQHLGVRTRASYNGNCSSFWIKWMVRPWANLLSSSLSLGFQADKIGIIEPSSYLERNSVFKLLCCTSELNIFIVSYW